MTEPPRASPSASAVGRATAVGRARAAELRSRLLPWYAAHARDLPWRRGDCSAWGVLVSEVMLQQTPVSRVEPVWREWLERWPRPRDLAAEPSGAAVRAWGRLGYPRRALRLHASATEIVRCHGGAVPADPEVLRTLPGVGDYTAAAVAAFAFGRAVPVLDTNVRRVLARAVRGEALPGPHQTRAEIELATRLLPEDETAPTWSVAVMELGATVCTFRSPACAACPLADRCRWRAAGQPAYAGPPRRSQSWHGTDRQCRGVLLGAVRDAAPADVAVPVLLAGWPHAEQADRCLATLLHDGLLEPAGENSVRLPG